jgi:hypothetical protein
MEETAWKNKRIWGSRYRQVEIHGVPAIHQEIHPIAQLFHVFIGGKLHRPRRRGALLPSIPSGGSGIANAIITPRD